MNNNKLTNVLLLILIILVIIVVGFIIIKKQKVGNSETNGIFNNQLEDLSKTENKEPGPNWGDLSKKELSEIVSIEKDVYFEEETGLTLLKEVDLTGDGINEAILEGNGWNNSVSFILIKDTENNTIVAKQKNQNDEINVVSLVSFGRSMISEGYDLAPSENGFYTISKYFDEKIKTFKCNTDGVSFYLWNPQSKLFEWDSVLTQKYTTEVCM